MDYMHESDQCLTELAEANKHLAAASRLLSQAPSADPLMKNAIGNESAECALHLDALIRRLDEL